MIKAKALISDLDCTLVDTLKQFFDVFNDCLKRRGRTTLNWNEFFEHYVEDTLDEVVAPEKNERREGTLHDFWMEFLWKYREGEVKAKLIPGVTEVFQRLHQKKIPIAVITSCIVPSRKLKEELDEYGIGRYVEVVVTAHDVVKDLERGHHFSKVEIFQLAAERLGVNPKDCVIVGDYWNDIRDGKRVGAKTVAVLTGLMRRGLLEKYGPDEIIENIGELETVVEFEA